MFHKDGAIGKQFKADRAIGSIGEKVGVQFASDGAIGKNFNPDGAIRGIVHENLGRKEWRLKEWTDEKHLRRHYTGIGTAMYIVNL